MKDSNDLGIASRNADDQPELQPSGQAKLLQEGQRVNFVGYRSEKQNSNPSVFVQKFASLGTGSETINWAWGICWTLLYPALAASVWFACIKTGSPQSDFGDKAVWLFLVNPITAAYLSFLTLQLFFTALSKDNPWRPLSNYLHILVLVYIAQVIYPGLYVVFRAPHALMGIPTIALTFIVTMVALRLTPHKLFDRNEERYMIAYKVFVKISIVYIIYMAILGAYMVANVQADGFYQGFLTFALTIVNFIFKKILLALTDRICIETAMLISGFWLENLTDLFVTMAFPTANESVTTFAIIFASRILENVAYLVFQTEPWFKFRIWIKGKFKKDQGTAIEADIDQDDRGHSAQHPGYRRRQLRFLISKYLSQLSSYVFFLIAIPALRYGPNKRRFPFTEAPPDRELDEELKPITREAFIDAIIFTAILIASVLISGAITWMYMHKYYPKIIVEVRELYSETSDQVSHYSLTVSIMISNALVAVMFLNSYYRVYYWD